jgi:hypothetical protein
MAAAARSGGTGPAPPQASHSAAPAARSAEQQVVTQRQPTRDDEALHRGERRMPHADVDQPRQGHALAGKRVLELPQQVRVPVHRSRRHAPLQRECGERARGLADVPLDGMQAEAAVGDVGSAEALAGGDEIVDAHRQQRAQRNLERTGARAQPDVLGPGTVDVDRIPAHTDRVGEVLRPRPRLAVDGDVLLEHRAERADAPALADVRMLGQPVGAAHDRRREPQLRRAEPRAVRRRLGLQPAQEPETRLLALLQRRRHVARGTVDEPGVAVDVRRC